MGRRPIAALRFCFGSGNGPVNPVQLDMAYAALVCGAQLYVLLFHCTIRNIAVFTREKMLLLLRWLSVCLKKPAVTF